jgi:hypothetical protein
MNRHEDLPELHLFRFKQMRFNVEFTPETLAACARASHIPTINHAPPAFTENKRYRAKRRAVDDVVNRNAVSVYQTD